MAPIKQPPSLLSRKKEEDTIIKKNNVSIEKGVGDILHSCNIDHVQFLFIFTKLKLLQPGVKNFLRTNASDRRGSFRQLRNIE